MSLHKHQHDALVARLKQPDLASLPADEAFARITADKNLLGLRFLGFVAQSKMDRLPPRRRKANLVAVPDGQAKDWPGGIPGFPNRLRREDFDLALEEALARS